MRVENLVRRLRLVVILVVAALHLSVQSGAMASEVMISLVTDRSPGAAGSHGVSKLMAALKSKGIAAERLTSLASARGQILIVAGLSSGPGQAAGLLKAADVTVPSQAESLAVHNTEYDGKPALVVAGSDDRGLMYALLDVADRIGWAEDPMNPLSEVRNAVEKPAVVERALSVYTMHRSHFESRFYNEDYWARYLDMLAKDRFNTFVLIFGYENWGYFSPPYPYFFDVEGFPEVRAVSITDEEQERNLKALNRLIEMTHERGLNFTLGIWDHIYRGGVQGPKQLTRAPTPGLVWGLTEKNLVSYSKAALAKFLRLVPDLDAIQFRMHGESGLKREEMREFWENIYQVVKECGKDIRFDARAKNFPDSLIDAALDMGINIRICTKYWAEQMGLPFHPTHINRQNQFDRRHGYADLLRYPQKYKMHWRLWNGGTSRILLWGDPEYVRRFAESTYLYNGEGFEVNEPLATKMQDHPHDIRPFELLAPQYKYYDWEFERYWHFFQVFGRVGYNPETLPEVWRKEFERRFGKDAASHVEKALHRASEILPRIVATCFPYNRFPMTRGWVEKQRREDLPVYAKAEGSDIQQFLSIDEAARCRLEGKESPKTWPQQTSRWFANAAADVLRLVEQAEQRIGGHKNKEFVSTTVDLKILANLALYHSRRIHAGVSWALYTHTQDLNALDDAIEHESRAIEAWEQIVESAGDVYYHDLMMGRRSAGLSGHWKDELVELRRGLEKLKQERTSYRPGVNDTQPWIAHVPVRKAQPGEDLVVRATVSSPSRVTRVRVSYRNGQVETCHMNMRQVRPLLYRAVIPGSEVIEGLTYFIQAVDEAGRRTTWPASGQKEPVAVIVTRDNQPPTLRHQLMTRAAVGKPLKIAAAVHDPCGVKWVRLRYRSVTQFEDYQTLGMLPTGQEGHYGAEVPVDHIVPKWDFMYFFEVMDKKGNGKIYPDLEKETPYIVVGLER